MRRGQDTRAALADHMVDVRISTGRTFGRDAMARFRANRFASGSAIGLLCLVLFAAVGPWVAAWPIDRIDWAAAADPMGVGAPGFATGHYFGTDNIGRDLFARTIQGLRVSLGVGLISAAISVVFGMVFGAVSGFRGGIVDATMMRLIDLLVALPGVFVIILLMVIFERTFGTLIAGLSLFGWLGTARIVRAQTLSLKERQFVDAARVSGVGWFTIVLRHIVPNLIGVVIVLASMSVPGMIMAESFISFIGLGLQEPNTSLGKLISDGAGSLLSGETWNLFYPLFFFVALMVCLYFIGDGLRDAVDPKSRKS